MTITSEPEQVVTTPTLRRQFRAARFWFVALVIIALAVIGYTALTPPSIDGSALAADGTGEMGAKALVSVLREHGVSVTATTSLSATVDAASSPNATTVFVYDPSGYLDTAQRARLKGLAARVVILSPTATALRDLAPGLVSAGTTTSALTAHCTASAAVRAHAIADGGQFYRTGDAVGVLHSCFPSGSKGYAMVQVRSSAGELTVVGATKAFTNEYIADQGNAALAINLLGSERHLVWYLPSIEDVSAGGNSVSLADAAPHWVEPLLLLGLLVVIAAAVWRGRRFGPVVVERLPVIVRASETMEGRARLYQSSSARLRALDALRVGTVQRIAASCGLSRRASLDEIIAAAASATGRTATEVRTLLVDTEPATDSDLLRLSDDLLVLEREVASRTRPA